MADEAVECVQALPEISGVLRRCIEDPLQADPLSEGLDGLVEGIDRLASAILGDPAAIAALAAQSYWHPLGFKKLLLWRGEGGRSLRIHRWHRTPADVGDIHDHYWDFRTVILRGGLQFREYTVTRGAGGYTEYEMDPLTLAGQHVLEHRGPAGLQLERSVFIGQGGAYSLRARIPHDTVCPEYAVTLMMQGVRIDRRNFVYRPGVHTGDIDASTLRNYDADEFVQNLHEVLAILKGESRV